MNVDLSWSEVLQAEKELVAQRGVANDLRASIRVGPSIQTCYVTPAAVSPDGREVQGVVSSFPGLGWPIRWLDPVRLTVDPMHGWTVSELSVPLTPRLVAVQVFVAQASADAYAAAGG